jgi:hypothetical protein
VRGGGRSPATRIDACRLLAAHRSPQPGVVLPLLGP